MPSSTSPLSVISQLTNGPNPPSAGVGGIVESLTAHITDPTAAHAASAISYAGGVAWADGTTNPAGNVETQLDKILTDLATGDGAGKIQYNGGAAWADGTTNPATTLGAQLDKIITDLNSLTAGSSKIGSGPINDTSVTILAGTVFDQLLALSNSINIQYNNSSSWADTTAFPDNNVQDALDEIVTRLAATTALDSGARKIGCEQINNTSVTIPAQSLVLTVRDATRATNNQYNAGPAWLGGRTNPDATVQAQLDKIINDLGATTTNDDGAERIGAAAAGSLLTTSVRGQLNELDTNWGKLSRANTWTNVNSFEGASGDTNPAITTTTVPTNRKLLWEIYNRTTLSAIFTRMYSDPGFTSLLITDNAFWNGTNWEADESTDPATMFKFNGGNSFFEVHLKGSTASPWATSGWDQSATYSSQSVFLGNTTISGPAPIVCTIEAENGKLRFANSANTLSSDTNPPATTGFFNVLVAKNIIKAWGSVTTGGGSPVLDNGFNIASVSYSGGTSSLIVTIQSDLANTDYAVVATAFNTSSKVLTWNNKAAGSFRISHFDSSTGTQTDLDTGGETITFMVIGEQDS